MSRERQLSIVASHSAAERTSALWLALRDEGLDCTREYAGWLLENRLSYHLSEEVLQTPEFDIRHVEDGVIRLVRYHGPDIVIRIDDDGTGTLTEAGTREISFSYSSKDGCVIIPSGVTEICPGFLDGHLRDVRRVVIPDGVRMIGNHSFRKCAALKEVTIPESVTSIGALAFGGCRSLRHIELPRHLESIGALAFCGCESLASVALPDSVKEVGYGTFMGCTSLASVRIPDAMTFPAESNVFYGCDALSVTAPRASSPQGWEAARQRLCDALRWFIYQYMNGPNRVYFLTIQGIDEPDASFMGDEVDDEDLEEEIRHYMRHSDWIILSCNVDIPARKVSLVTDFAERLIVDTLRGHGVRVFRDNDDSEECWDYYETLFRCTMMLCLRFLYVDSAWYAMVFEWSD